MNGDDEVAPKSLLDVVASWTVGTWWRASGKKQESEYAIEGACQHCVTMADGSIKDFPGAAEELNHKWEDVAWEMSGARCAGKLCLTNFRAIFVPGEPIAGMTDFKLTLEIPWGVVEQVKWIQRFARVCTEKGKVYHDVIEMRCCDLRVVHLLRHENSEKKSTLGDVYESIAELWESSREPSDCRNCLSRHFTEKVGTSKGFHDSEKDNLDMFWDKEFKRMEIDTSKWRSFDKNADYKLCDSYPSKWWVPKDITDNQVQNASKFRKHRRMPLLTWRHKERGSLLLRSSQPSFRGPLRKFAARDDPSAIADVELIAAVRKAAGPGRLLCFLFPDSGG